ncbi:MAG: hypothetical protein M1339_05375 [Bacteroidetes bacterium]|nr:hypothetical protein [Bacteroidota bacterium]
MIFQTSINISDLISLLTIIVAVVIGLIEIRQMLKQIRLSSFAEYTKRYQDILLSLPSTYFTDSFSVDRLSDEQREDISKRIRVYFDLCSEEYFLHREGYIPAAVWNEWEQGILSNLGLKHVQSEWTDASLRAEIYGEFKKSLAATLDGTQA